MKNVQKFYENNKDKHYCKGMYIGSGRGGANWEICAHRDKCLKYKEWIIDGNPLANYKEHVIVERVPLSIFRQCFYMMCKSSKVKI